MGLGPKDFEVEVEQAYFFAVRPKTQGEKNSNSSNFSLKLKQYFQKNSRNRKFSKTLTANLLKLTTIWTTNVTFSNFLL